MKHLWIARLLAAVLALVLTASLGATAFADTYDADQSYTVEKDGEKVYAVCVSSEDEEEPAALRDRLLEAGYDAYLYESNGKVRVLCGKFRDAADARSSRDGMGESVDGVKAYVIFARLPAEAVKAFEAGPHAEKKEESKPKVTRKTSSWQDTEGSQVYSVSLSASQDISYAESLVAKMEAAGFDAFILEEGAYYRVLSGKFHDICNALLYRDCIWSNTDRTDTYIATVTVPQDEIDAFTEDYEKNGLPGKIKDNLEKPTGAFYREKNGQVLAYTVQFSAGTSFSGAERNRDAMSGAGFPAFVYECSRVYEIMTGAFYNKADAEAWCQKVKDNTGEYDAYVTTAWLPSGIVK